MGHERRQRPGGGSALADALTELGIFRGSLEARYISYALGDSRPLWAGAAGISARLGRESSARAEYSWRGRVKEAGVYYHHFVFPP
jgi:hypothetical protein